MSERKNKGGRVVLGLLLVAAGALTILLQAMNLSIPGGIIGLIWPLFVLIPGLALFLVVREGGEAAEVASIFAGILTMVGIVLFYQNITDHWQSWAYVWALVAPGGVAVGRLAYGTVNDKLAAREEGRNLLYVSLSMFLVGIIFFELVLNISGFTSGLQGWGLPILLIVLGALMLFRNLFGRRTQSGVPIEPGQEFEPIGTSNTDEDRNEPLR